MEHVKLNCRYIYIMIVLKENIVEMETKKNKERVFFS